VRGDLNTAVSRVVPDESRPRGPDGAVSTTSPWLASLTQSGGAPGLRAALLVCHPAFDPARIERLAIVGAAGEGRRLAAICQALGIAVVAVADDDPTRVGTLIAGMAVIPTARLTEFDRALPIVIASHRVLKATAGLRALGFVNVAPFAVLQVLDPSLFPPHMFYDGWVEDLWINRQRYGALASRLADERSRGVLDAVLGFRQTLDPASLAPIIEWDLYGPSGLIRYGADEVYVDGGSFDGDTIRLFVDRVGGKFSRVLAFEPDPDTFARLRANFAGDPRIEPINAGLHRRGGVLRFHNDASRGAIFQAEGAIEIPVVALDEVLEGGRVSFIKMNIEGAEIEALAGAAGAIRRWRPKLAISAYHRPSDLWQVAETVDALYPDYDLYLRQHDGGVIETVLYALPPDEANARKRGPT
jgi:FkbM family methyltransferase